MEGKTNIDHICAILVDQDGKTVYKKIPIIKGLLQYQLEELNSDPDASVHEMARVMDRSFNGSREPRDFCAPYEYCDRYIKKCEYPRPVSLSPWESVRGGRYWDPEVRKKAAELRRAREKKAYLKIASRLIDAENYEKTIARSVKPIPNVKMYSTENIGWTHFNYEVTNDISIRLETNFCYGASAYFRLCLTYRGITILPYSLLVSYYHVSSYELARFTRSYPPLRASWDNAFRFIEQTCNLATERPKQFIRKWILNEITAMMKGLRRLLVEDSDVIGQYLSNAGRNVSDRIHRVRNMRMDEKTNYAVYGREMDMAIKAEKISGAVAFLENLAELSKELPEIEGSIAEIRMLAASLLPEMDLMTGTIESGIKVLREDQAAQEKALAPISTKIQYHEKIIKRLEERASKKNRICDYGTIKETYKDNHPQYVKLLGEAETIKGEISRLVSDIIHRENFRSLIISCRNIITEAGITVSDSNKPETQA